MYNASHNLGKDTYVFFNGDSMFVDSINANSIPKSDSDATGQNRISYSKQKQDSTSNSHTIDVISMEEKRPAKSNNIRSTDAISLDNLDNLSKCSTFLGSSMKKHIEDILEYGDMKENSNPILESRNAHQLFRSCNAWETHGVFSLHFLCTFLYTSRLTVG